MTNCLTWCWQELLERWDIYIKTNKQKFTLEMLLVIYMYYNSIPTNTFPGKITRYTRPEKRDRRESKTRKQKALCIEEEPVFHDHVAS